MPDASHLLFYLRILQLPSDGETLSDGSEGGLWQTGGRCPQFMFPTLNFHLILYVAPGQPPPCANGPKFASFPSGEHRRLSADDTLHDVWQCSEHIFVRHHDILNASSFIIPSSGRLNIEFHHLILWNMNSKMNQTVCMDDGEIYDTLCQVCG